MNLKRILVVPIFLGALATLAGWGGLAQPAPNRAVTGEAKPSVVSPSPGAPAQGRAAGVPIQTDSQASTAGLANSAAFQGAAGLQPLPPVNRLIVKNATLGISVEEPEATLSQVDQLVKTEQGVIASQTVRSQQDKTFVNLTIQLPPENFEEALAKLRDLRARGTRVLNDTVSSQDVTEQFVDLEAQYRNLQATRDAYQKLLDKAGAVSDVITLTREIANVQTRMDQIKGRENLLGREAGVSTINLALSPVGASLSPGPRPLPGPVQAAQDAWQALLVGLRGLSVVLIWVGILLPIPALALLAGWLVYRRVTRVSSGSASPTRPAG